MKLSVTVRHGWRFAALAVVLVGLAVTPAAADQGQPVLAGQLNTETSDSTALWNQSFSTTCSAERATGLTACGDTGVDGYGTTNGVFGFANTTGVGDGVEGQGPTGVFGFSPVDGGTGVFGNSEGTTGIGVEGQNNGTGSAVYGLANSTGVGVFGDTTSGTGVLARSTSGTALDVRGKATFSRSGMVTIAAGSASKKITLAGVTTASMILATAQQDGTVYVRSAVPASGSFTIHLTGKAPAGGLKVAYFVLN
jgi:hypothetical protein